MKNNKLTIPFIITLIATLLLIATVFLPYATATDAYKEVLNAYPDATIYTGSEITAGDMLNISMFEYVGLYTTLSAQILGSSAYSVIYIAMIVLIGGFGVISALFALLKKPVPVIVFSTLSFGVFLVQCFDYTDRHVIGSTSYNFGIGYYLFFVAFAIALIGAIWMLVLKHKLKNQSNTTSTVTE